MTPYRSLLHWATQKGYKQEKNWLDKPWHWVFDLVMFNCGMWSCGALDGISMQYSYEADSRQRSSIPVSYFYDLICLIYILYWGVHCAWCMPGVCLVYLCDAWACVLFMYAVYLLRLWAVCKMQTRQITHSILFSVLEWGHPITWHQAWKDNEESKCKEHEPERKHYIFSMWCLTCNYYIY